MKKIYMKDLKIEDGNIFKISGRNYMIKGIPVEGLVVSATGYDKTGKAEMIVIHVNENVDSGTSLLVYGKWNFDIKDVVIRLVYEEEIKKEEGNKNGN